VADNSHLHNAGNITGLNNSHSHIIANITNLETELSKYLLRAGGEMTGTITFQ
jgi:hypothetical protein